MTYICSLWVYTGIAVLYVRIYTSIYIYIHSTIGVYDIIGQFNSGS